MDKYFMKHIRPALKKYNFNLNDILKKAQESKSYAEAFFPPKNNTEEEWEISSIKFNIAYYMLLGCKIFDEKERVIKDWIGVKNKCAKTLKKTANAV